MQRIFMVPTLKILQIERNTKETKVYFYFRDAAYLQGVAHFLIRERRAKQASAYFVLPSIFMS
jgi:hypothetical protein